MVEETSEMIEQGPGNREAGVLVSPETCAAGDPTCAGKEPSPTPHDQLARKSSVTLGGSLLVTLFGLLVLVAVKRYMGYEAVGILSFSLAFCQMFAIIGDLGFSQAHLKRSSEGRDPGSCTGTYLSVKLFLTGIMGAVILGWLVVQKFVFDFSFESEGYSSAEIEAVLVLVIISYMLLNMSMGLRTVFVARLEMARATIPHILSRFLVTVIKLLATAALGLGLIYLAWAELVGMVLLVLLYLYLFRNYPLKRPSRALIKDYTTFAFPMLFVGFVGSLAYNLDKVVLGYLSNQVEVGVYTIPQRIAVSLLFRATTITSLLFVVFSDHYENKRLEEIKRLTRKAEKYISTLLLPIIVVLFVFAKTILGMVFGEGTDDSAPVLRLMLLALYIEATLIPYHTQLVSSGHLRLAMYVGAVALVMNLGLDLLLVPGELLGVSLPGMGAEGAALATLLTLTLRSLLVRFYAFRLTGSKPNPRVLLHISAALLSGVLGQGLLHFLPFHWTLVLVYAPLLIGIYLLAISLLGEFGKKDLQFYLDAIHPGKMRDYISDEISERT